MKRTLHALSRRYEVAMRRHLKQGPRASLRPARGLGRQAVALGLETLDLARIHVGALARLEAAGSGAGLISRAELFFAEVITPIESTHRASLKAKARLTQFNKTLARRTMSLKMAHRRLKQGVAQRKAVQQALKKSGGHSTNLLKQSRALQGQLRRLARRLLSAQEEKRKKISRELHNEIAQTLLGINVRLLALKKEATVNAEGLHNEIASTQQLVEKSAMTLNRFAREFGLHHES